MTEDVGSLGTVQPLSESQLEAGYLYAVLTYRGELASWNWAFFIPDPSVSPIGALGTVFHVVHEIDESRTVWKFIRERKEVLASPLVVTIVRLADVSFLGQYQDLIVSEDLMGMYHQVKVPVNDPPEFAFSSRTWFLDAITILNEYGVLSCEDAWELEREIRRLGFAAMDKYLQNKDQAGRYLLQGIVPDGNDAGHML